MDKVEAKLKAKQAAADLMIAANMALFEAVDVLSPHASPAFEHEISAIQERLREATGAVQRLQ